MSIHPNVMLMAHLSPNDLPRKTFLAMVDPSDFDEHRVTIGGDEYHAILLEGSYYEGLQVSGNPGEIVLMDMVTYGYGERIAWDALVEKRDRLIAWVEENAAKHNLTFVGISVGANYW